MHPNLRRSAWLSMLGVSVVGMLVVAQSASANIVRPAGATPIGASTVIAYAPCVAPGAGQHNPANLPGAACAPVQYTPRLTAGDPTVNGSGANFRGNIKLAVTLAVGCLSHLRVLSVRSPVQMRSVRHS